MGQAPSGQPGSRAQRVTFQMFFHCLSLPSAALPPAGPAGSGNSPDSGWRAGGGAGWTRERPCPARSRPGDKWAAPRGGLSGWGAGGSPCGRFSLPTPHTPCRAGGPSVPHWHARALLPTTFWAPPLRPGPALPRHHRWVWWRSARRCQGGPRVVPGGRPPLGRRPEVLCPPWRPRKEPRMLN